MRHEIVRVKRGFVVRPVRKPRRLSEYHGPYRAATIKDAKAEAAADAKGLTKFHQENGDD